MPIWQIKGLEQAFVFVRDIVVVNGQSGNFSVALSDPLVEYCLVLEVSLRRDMNGDVKISCCFLAYPRSLEMWQTPGELTLVPEIQSIVRVV